MLGQQEGEEWYLFTTDNEANDLQAADVTLEVLMSDLDESTMQHFTSAKYKDSQELARVRGWYTFSRDLTVSLE